MRTRGIPLFAWVLVGALAGCGGADDTTGDDPEQEVIPPGDPRFVRDPALDVENISVRGEKRSHNMGLNCMGCHQPHGPGRGLFTAAGTVYGADGKQPVPGGTVELRTAPGEGGELVLAIDVDENGNFFTTAELPFPDRSLFPVVKTPAAEQASFMPFPTLSGACNHCHTEASRVPGG